MQIPGKTYIVGGAVRDKLLGRSVSDRDWVVVGATVQEMLDAGFNQVGRDFPVFLHPETNEEYALARTERKSGSGYYGFTVNASPDVTLREDLQRRDLTINAMAMVPETGEIIDPFNGQRDLENGVLRHVSDAFAEDPLRVLRVARFAARYNFKVHRETLRMMHSLADEIKTVARERVWTEMSKAIKERHPANFFTVLADSYCMQPALFITPSHLRSSSLQRLNVAATLRAEEWERWMILFVDVPYDQAEVLTDTWGLPNRLIKPALMANYIHNYVHWGPMNNPTRFCEDAFKKFRFNQKENLDMLARIIATGVLYCEWPRDEHIKILNAMEHAAKVKPTDSFVTGAETGRDLERQRNAVYHKYLGYE